VSVTSGQSGRPGSRLAPPPTLALLPLILLVLWSAAGCGRNRPLPPPELTPKPPTDEAAAPEGVVHVVERGQTLWRIARAYGIALDVLAEANGIGDPTQIEVGQRLMIPGAKKVIDVPPHRPDEDDTSGTEVAEGDYIWPVDGRVGSRFGLRGGRRHGGIDINAPIGAPIRAARSGEVFYAGSKYRGYGKLVIIDHGRGVRTYYAHNRENLVKTGEKVKQGQKIARVGQTGNATGPHLHFEIRRGNTLLDPLRYLPSRAMARK
jgi:lipoprotein NlpD